MKHAMSLSLTKGRIAIAATVLLVACGASDNGSTERPAPSGGSAGSAGAPGGAGGSAGAATGGDTYTEGGAAGAPHPLFGTGAYGSTDLSDPCEASQIWEENTAIELETGTVVLYDGKLWRLNGDPGDTAWALSDCTPPGTGWCATQYDWEEVGTCPSG
jgi:hypothetical protein